jgi:hypothetical protein
MGVDIDVIGHIAGQYTDAPEKILGKYDLVFGKAKCALEAMAVGAAVICCDFRGLGGLVTQSQVAAWRKWNFGMKILNRPITVDAICEEIKRYDAKDAAWVSQWIRNDVCLEVFLDKIERIYMDVAKHRRVGKLQRTERLTFRKLRRQRGWEKVIRKLWSHVPILRTWFLQLKSRFSSAS